MYYRGSAAAVVVYDITKLVRATLRSLSQTDTEVVTLNRVLEITKLVQRRSDPYYKTPRKVHSLPCFQLATIHL